MHKNDTKWMLVLLIWGVAALQQVSAQCERVGWIASISPDCGATIIDLNSGEIFKAVAGLGGLDGGMTITFTETPAIPTPGCDYEGYETVSLSCVSQSLPCAASFGQIIDASNALTVTFDADIYDATTQVCTWDFGDGNTATGKTVEHTFAAEGNYNVCLTVSDAFGCNVQACKNIEVSTANPNWCGWDIQVTAVGKQLFGKMVQTGSDANPISSIQWYSNKTSQLLATTEAFSVEVPDYGVYQICAQYEVSDSLGSTCISTRCHQLTIVETGCVSPIMADGSTACPPTYAPVCGCDGVTYANECEAMMAGVLNWWAGPCNSNDDCSSDMEIKLVSGSIDGNYTVRFYNHSGGNYVFSQLDFGDSTDFWEAIQWDSVDHVYAHSGIYRANLSVWKEAQCVSSMTKLLVTDAFTMNNGDMPNVTDYVMPGDANGDRKANMYDMLNIGLGYNLEGAPRPFASTDWTPQFAPNWVNATNNGVNYKHFDCNGDGAVDDQDPDVTVAHYVPLDTFDLPAVNGKPRIWLEFSQDTIYVDPDNPAPLSIEADVMLGNVTQPVIGLYGLAFALKYPEYIDHDPVAIYDNNSFFGPNNHILFLGKDNYDRRQFDMGFSRKWGQSVNGVGRIAKLTFKADFVIIIDVIDRNENKLNAFSVPVKGLLAVDAAGNKLDFVAPETQDTLWIKMLQTTKVETVEGEHSVHLAPNPAGDVVNLSTGTVPVEKISIVNALGQAVSNIQPTNNSLYQIRVADWETGVYTILLHTARGVIEKRLVVK